MNGRKLDRRRSNGDFRLRVLIPAVLLVGLLIVLIGSDPLEAVPSALVIVGAGVLAGGVVGFLTGVRGPHWPIYALILTGLAVLLLSPLPWQGLALVPVPASAIGYAIGKEVAFFRLDRRHPAPSVRA